jgi:hypothetical protein
MHFCHVIKWEKKNLHRKRDTPEPPGGTDPCDTFKKFLITLHRFFVQFFSLITLGDPGNTFFPRHFTSIFLINFFLHHFPSKKGHELFKDPPIKWLNDLS